MRLNFFPTPKASKQSKKEWLLLEIMRYKNFIKQTQTLKLMLSLGIVLGALHLLGTGWPVCIGLMVGLLVFDFHFELLIFYNSRDFLLDMVEACFDIDAVTDHDFRILMNRVENFIKTKDTDKRDTLYKSLEECYDVMKLKVDIKEAFDDLQKGKVQEEAKS